MGWKGTIYISRNEAKRLIMLRMAVIDALTNEELGDLVDSLGYGDDCELAHYGDHIVVEDNDN